MKQTYCFIHTIPFPPPPSQKALLMKIPNKVKSLQSIAAEWHNGQGSALYAFCSSGTIQPGLSKEISECFSRAQIKELHDLQRLYVATALPITRETITDANEFWHRYMRNADNSPVRCRKTGKTHLWKTRPTDYRIPVKCGLKESFYITPEIAINWCIAP